MADADGFPFLKSLRLNITVGMSCFHPLCLVGTRHPTIDFAELKGRTFFSSTARTGAGKTTILDAVCFALYGDASNRTPEQ